MTVRTTSDCANVYCDDVLSKASTLIALAENPAKKKEREKKLKPTFQGVSLDNNYNNIMHVGHRG